MNPKKPKELGTEQSRFGESRFEASRFNQAAGSWLEEGRPDAQGRASGWYRPADDKATGVTGLTVVRPPQQQAAATSGAAGKKKSETLPLVLPGGRRGVLLFHGLSSTPLELQFLARGLHRSGYSVRIAVIEGYSHGLPSAAATGFREWAKAAVGEFDRMKAQCDSVAVGGLCIGALLSLHVAAQRSALVSHVLALSTTMRYDGWAAPRTRWLLPLARVLPWAGQIAVREREPFGLKDERLRAWIAAQMKESGGSDAGAAVLRVRDLLEAQNLMGIVRRSMKSIVAPTLLLHARDDDAASPKSAFEVASGVSSSRVHCVILNDSYHMISIDKEKAKVLSEMKDFLQSEKGPSETSETATSTTAGTATPRSTENVRV